MNLEKMQNAEKLKLCRRYYFGKMHFLELHAEVGSQYFESIFGNDTDTWQKLYR